MTPQNEPERILEGLLSITGPGNGFSRRQFLRPGYEHGHEMFSLRWETQVRQACPAEALAFVAWRDLTRNVAAGRPECRYFRREAAGLHGVPQTLSRKDACHGQAGGWAGKVLRVDLSTGKISTEDTLEKYRDYLGGTGKGTRSSGTKSRREPSRSTRKTRWSSNRPPGRDRRPLQRSDRHYNAVVDLLADAAGRKRTHGRPLCRGA